MSSCKCTRYVHSSLAKHRAQHSCFSSSLASACSPHDTTHSLCTAVNGPKYVDTSAICLVLTCCSCQHLRAVGQIEIVLYLHNNQITLTLLTASCVHKHMAHVEDHKFFFLFFFSITEAGPSIVCKTGVHRKHTVFLCGEQTGSYTSECFSFSQI